MDWNHFKGKRCRRVNGTRHRSAFAAASFILTASLLAVLLAACPAASPDVPPGAPTITSATPGDGNVTLVWTAPEDTGITGGDGAAGLITKYTVYYSESAITDLTATGVTSTDASDTSTLTKEVIGLTNGTTYYFVMTASNAAGEGAPSDEKTAAPAAETALIVDIDVN